MGSPRSLRLSHFVARTSCEGPGSRAALWVTGCSLRCPGCCNPELFDPRGGEAVEVHELVERLVAEEERGALDGISVLGGEPMEQPQALIELLSRVRARRPAWGVIAFTGYTVEELKTRPAWTRLSTLVDTFVAGRFDATQLEAVHGGRRFIGSANQRLVHLSSRYADDALWRGPAQAEIHIGAHGEVSVHGDPELTRRLRRRLRLAPSATASV